MNFLIAIYLLFHDPNYNVPDFVISAKGELVEVYKETAYSAKFSKDALLSSKEVLDDVILDTPDVLDKLMEFPIHLPMRTSCPEPIRQLRAITVVDP
jgi:hypothetical protein